MHKCGLPVKVLLVELGHSKIESNFEQYKAFLSEKILSLAFPGFSGKLRLCNKNSMTQRTRTDEVLTAKST